jgi:alkanesulfonate monooxygenase SsuD/methylene tetrahydromethanopterin reductase-like flavin-dependent oxidoreductase (luciferase family)
MRFGYFTMPLHSPEVPLDQTLAEDLSQIELLDKLGFSEAWIGEHLTSAFENIPAPDLLIAQALGRTSNIALGTGVNCLPNHNPLMLAMRVAQLDQMARGRFLWGIGSGGFVGDLEMFQVDSTPDESRQVTLDILDTVLRLWSDPRPGIWEHPRWRFKIPEPRPEISLRMFWRPFQQPHPPIGVAGVTPTSNMFKLAGERGWMPMSLNIVPLAALQANWRTYADAASQAGRTPDAGAWRIARDVFVADSPQAARQLAIDGVVGRDWREYFLPLLGGTGRLGLTKVDRNMADSDVTLDYLYDNIWIMGDPEQVAEKLRSLYQSVGGFGTLLLMGHEWRPRDVWERSMRLFVDEVMPRLGDLVLAGEPGVAAARA